MGSGDRLGGISMAGARDASNTMSFATSVEAFTAAAWSGTSTPTYLSFKTCAVNATARVENMRIESDGRLSLTNGIINPTADSTTAIRFNKADGTTNVATIDTTNSRLGIGTTAPAYKLDVSSGSTSDVAKFYSGGANSRVIVDSSGNNSGIRLQGSVS